MKDFGKKETIDEVSDMTEESPKKDNIFDIERY